MCFASNGRTGFFVLLLQPLLLLFLLFCLNDSGLVVVALLGADHEAEALGDVAVLHTLLHHQAPLGPQGDHRGEQGEAVHVWIVVVVPQLEQGKEGPSSTNPSTAVHQDRTQINLKVQQQEIGKQEFPSPKLYKLT